MISIRIYTNVGHYNNQFRGELINLLKPFIGKKLTDEERVSEYGGGISSKNIHFVENIKECDYCILPMSWNYYHKTKQLSKAIDFVKKASEAGKKVLSWTSGDFGVKVPHYENVLVIRPSGYRTRLPSYHQGMPVFIKDPLKRWYQREDIFLREKREKPIIGFCGQSKGSLQKYITDITRTAWRNIKYHTGLSPFDPEALYPSTLRRARILKKIESHPNLNPNFIKRDRYRAGANTPDEKLKTTLEFYDNIIQSDYTVCVRGGGNFSIRLYEVLAMGRIPIFINTDCMMPLEEQIDWKDHCIWVEEKDINHIGDIVAQYHNQISSDQFEALQQANRDLWMNSLRLSNFFHKIIS